MTLASVGCGGGFVYDTMFGLKFRNAFLYQLLDFLFLVRPSYSAMYPSLSSRIWGMRSVYRGNSSFILAHL